MIWEEARIQEFFAKRLEEAGYAVHHMGNGEIESRAEGDIVARFNNSTQQYTKEEQEILKNAPRDENGNLLAPNGKPTNLTEKQYAQVRTKAFKEWFGDWEKISNFELELKLKEYEARLERNAATIGNGNQRGDSELFFDAQRWIGHQRYSGDENQINKQGVSS